MLLRRCKVGTVGTVMNFCRKLSAVSISTYCMTKYMTIFLRNLKRSKYDFVMHITISLKSATQRAPRGNFFLQKRKKIVATLSSKLDLIEKSIFDHYYLPPLFTRIFGRLWQAFHTNQMKVSCMEYGSS